jgi:hypothetical protein
LTDPTPPREDQRTLRQMHDDLRTACAELVDPTQFHDERDDGTVVVVEGDSLLTQLQDAAGSSQMSGGGPAKSQPILINPDAVELFADIETATAEWCDEPTVEQRIRAGTNLAGQWTTTADILWITSQLRRWTQQIQELFNPPKRWHLAAPCPACGTRMVWRKDDTTGETVQAPALDLQQVGEGTERRWECTCLNPACRHRWPSGTLEHLALVLDQERAETNSRVTGEALALWQDGSIHRTNTPSSNMALPVDQRINPWPAVRSPEEDRWHRDTPC